MAISLGFVIIKADYFLQTVYNNFENSPVPSENEDEETPHFSEVELEQIKTEFAKPFSDEEVDSVWKSLSQLRPSAYPPKKELLHRDLGGLDYKIYATHFGETRCLIFQLLTEDHQKPAEIIFEQDIYNKPGVWEMPHRIVRTGELGISGTDFLQKAEEYLQELKEKKFDKVDSIEVDSSQAKVINWLIKNGYEVADEESKQKLEDYKNNPEDFEEIFIDNEDGVPEKDLFLIKKSEIDYQALEKSTIGQVDGIREIQVSLYTMKTLSGIVRIHLQKTFK